MADRTPRCRPLPPEVVARVGAPATGTPDAELLERLEAALAELPTEERVAVVSALGYAGGPRAAAVELGISDVDAESLTRSAVQLLRGALAALGSEPDPPPGHGSLTRRRRPHVE